MSPSSVPRDRPSCAAWPALGMALWLAGCGASTEPGGGAGECGAGEPTAPVHGLDLAPEGAMDGRVVEVSSASARITLADGTPVTFRWLGAPLHDYFHVGEAVVVERRREVLDDFPPFEAAATVDILAGRDRRAIALQLVEAERYAFEDAVDVTLGAVRCCADCSESPEAAVLSCQQHGVIAQSRGAEAEIPVGRTRVLEDWILTPVEATSISAVPGPAAPCTYDDTERVRIGVDLLGPAG